ncbi:hypothetical protein [Streptomyces xanthophaeus]|uniref:hypothetical protein n=1 Tax=Streptomyces xanthophaeus TaxID=67385 RepID=UPI0037195C61
MHHDDQTGDRMDTFRSPMHRMETYERPSARTPLRPHHTSGHSPEGEGCAGNDPAYRGL